MSVNWDRVWALPAAFRFLDAQSLLQLQEVNRRLRKIISVEDMAHVLPMKRACDDCDGDPEGMEIRISLGWSPEFSTREAVIQKALSDVPWTTSWGCFGENTVDQAGGEELFRRRGWLDSDDFNSDGEVASEETEEAEESEVGWNVCYTFIPKLSARDAKSRAREILDLLNLREDEGWPPETVEEGSCSKKDLRRTVAFLLRRAKLHSAPIQYADWGLLHRHTDLPSRRNQSSLMFQFGSTRIEVTGSYGHVTL